MTALRVDGTTAPARGSVAYFALIAERPNLLNHYA
jgi:hypothetical protein